MGLVDSISKFITELLDNLLDPVEVLAGSKVSDHTFETIYLSAHGRLDGLWMILLERSNLPFVVELIIKCPLYAYIHGWGMRISLVHTRGRDRLCHLHALLLWVSVCSTYYSMRQALEGRKRKPHNSFSQSTSNSVSQWSNKDLQVTISRSKMETVQNATSSVLDVRSVNG